MDFLIRYLGGEANPRGVFCFWVKDKTPAVCMITLEGKKNISPNPVFFSFYLALGFVICQHENIPFAILVFSPEVK